MLQEIRLGARPVSNTREGRLAKLWGPSETPANKMLVLARQIQPALLCLGSEAVSQVCMSYFMKVFVGQSLSLGPHKSCSSDWEHTGTVGPQPPYGK